ncbi:hypothetical protein [Streptomyces sp. NPDC002156]
MTQPPVPATSGNGVPRRIVRLVHNATAQHSTEPDPPTICDDVSLIGGSGPRSDHSRTAVLPDHSRAY